MDDQQSDDLMCIEVQISSVVSPEKLQLYNVSPESTPQKPIKRKKHDNVLRQPFAKRIRGTDSNKESSNCDTSDDDSEHRLKKAKERSRSKKKNLEIDSTEIKHVLDGMDGEINDVLEETAEKNKLTPANVRNILKHVITNEYVLAMVRNTMKLEQSECDDLEEAVFEPKLTRSKVKELREKQHMLPWVMSTPVKQPESATKALLEEEFPDESSSDEDYKPNEEECPSEEDNIVSSPKSSHLNSSFSEKPASVTKPVEENADDEFGLVIALPETEPTPTDTEVDKIALRTRSKLPLKDTPLEVIEASFIAPDISEDLYDTNCDDEDWQKFIREYKALDSMVAIQKPDEEPDDADDDPEYNVLEDDDIPDEFDFRYDNSVKVSKQELKALVAELMELDDGDVDYEEEEECETPSRRKTPVLHADDGFVENVRTQWMTDEERFQLEEQMRMYVQLLTQSYLLSFGYPELNFINVSSKLFLDEIKMFASNSVTVNERSAFDAHNLNQALEIVNYYEDNRNKINLRCTNFSLKRQPGLPSVQIKKTIYNSQVFMYPELLPSCGYHKRFENRKASFTPAEDNLIALGLEEFSFSPTPVYYINILLVPPKTEYQIKLRIKNSKGARGAQGNPIKYYFQHGRAPSFPRTIRVFDPNNVKAPKDLPHELLPKWMSVFAGPKIVSNASSTILPKPPKTAVSLKKRSFNRKAISKPSYRVLLPRGNHLSPLKQISPILRKYKRRLSTVLLPSNTSRLRKTPLKTLAIKPTLALQKSINSGEERNGENNIESNVSLDNIGETEKLNLDRSGISDGKIEQNTCNATYLVNSKIVGTSECIPDINASECDVPIELEVVDEGDEEIIDDEPESAHQDSTVTNIINKKQSANKKKNKVQRDLESSLALLKPNLIENDPKKEERETLFANSYLLRATEALKEDPDVQEKFIKILCKYQYSAKSPVKIYFEIKEILKDYPAIADDFIAFLNPEQAKDCGKYKEHVTLSKIRAFIRKIEVHFGNQPQHLLKILRTFAQFKQQSSISSVEVLSSLQPLLKNQSHLLEELTNLLPDMAPPESLMTDFQEVTIPNSDDDNSSVDSCEEVLIPEAPDPYGGKDCPCKCHTSSTEAKVVNKTRHCTKCGVKFMDGKVYIQTGKVLKPAQVFYQDMPPEPAKISNNDSKATTKSKQPNCSPTTKYPVVAEQSCKSEAPQVKKDPLKTSAVQHPPVLPEEPVPSTSKLPCDVFEDTVFPAVPVCTSKKSVPSDFSQLKEVIGHTNDKDCSPNGNSKPSDNHADATNSAEQANRSPVSVTHQGAKWNREEDKLIIYNCQRLGFSDKAFEATSSALISRTPEEVQDRFLHLMDLLSKEFKL